MSNSFPTENCIFTNCISSWIDQDQFKYSNNLRNKALFKSLKCMPTSIFECRYVVPRASLLELKDSADIVKHGWITWKNVAICYTACFLQGDSPIAYVATGWAIRVPIQSVGRLSQIYFGVPFVKYISEFPSSSKQSKHYKVDTRSSTAK